LGKLSFIEGLGEGLLLGLKWGDFLKFLKGGLPNFGGHGIFGLFFPQTPRCWGIEDLFTQEPLLTQKVYDGVFQQQDFLTLFLPGAFGERPTNP